MGGSAYCTVCKKEKGNYWCALCGGVRWGCKEHDHGGKLPKGISHLY